jgi:hypothetical protein
MERHPGRDSAPRDQFSDLGPENRPISAQIGRFSEQLPSSNKFAGDLHHVTFHKRRKVSTV